MLVASVMDGMDEMSVFCENRRLHPLSTLGLLMVTAELSADDAVATDDHCVESLYPPGMCVSATTLMTKWITPDL